MSPAPESSREETTPADAPAYEPPVVEDLDTVDGPAVTAAGVTKS